MTPEQRGDRARNLLNDDVLKDALDMIEKDCLDQWRATSFRDADAREKLWMQVKAIDIFRAKLHQAVADGA